MSEVSILKLRDGATVVGKVTFSDGKYLVEHPIEMVSSTGLLKQGMGEAINLKPWVAIAEEHVFTVEKDNVVTVATLNKRFIEGYHNMVQAIYFQEPHWQGNFLDEDDGELPELDEGDMDIDTLTELADAVLKNKIH